VLTNAEKRRQFDSVDPVFMELEEDMPTATEFAKVRIPFFFFWIRFLWVVVLLLTFGERRYRIRISISSRRSRRCLSFIRGSPRPNLYLVSAILTRRRRKWKDSMISGTTLTAGEVSSG